LGENLIKTIIVLLFFIFSISASASQTLNFSTGEWPPYTSEKDPHARVLQTIVTEVYKLANIDVLYHYYPWKRALRSANEFEVEGTLPWSWSAKREEIYYYSKQPIIMTRTVFFHLKSQEVKWDTFEDLKKYTIGGNLGYRSTDVLLENNIDLELVETEPQNFKKLLRGRIDLTPSSLFVGYYIINNLFSKSKALLFTNTTKQLLPENGVHLLIPKNHPRGKEIINTFDREFENLVKSGMYDKIIDDFLFNKKD
jgi:polar amino acid transport system substrate-binding protein